MTVIGTDTLQNFKALFIGIILEAFPFLLLGVLLSSILQVFVTDQTLRRIIPKNPVAAVVLTSLLGFILPICECGAIPIIRRLIRKGLPAFAAVTFALASPVINPVVFASTYMAFRSRPDMAYSRLGLAFVAVVIIGLLLYKIIRSNPLKHEHGSTSGMQLHVHNHPPEGKLSSILRHSSDEFFEMGKYLIFGAFLTAAIQVGIARETLVALGQEGLQSHVFMMAFAFVLSLCSTSDAFVAASFSTTFSVGSLLTFLVFGPMLDLKSTFMLLSTFKARFVLTLIGITCVVVLAVSLLYEAFVLM